MRHKRVVGDTLGAAAIDTDARMRHRCVAFDAPRLQANATGGRRRHGCVADNAFFKFGGFYSCQVRAMMIVAYLVSYCGRTAGRCARNGAEV